MPLGDWVLSKGGKMDIPYKDVFTAVGWSSVNMATDRHKHAVCHNKHWRRAS